MKDFLALIRLTRRHWKTYTIALLTVALTTACYLLMPPQIGRFIESLRDMKTGYAGGAAIRPMLAIVALLALSAFFDLIYSFFVSLASEKIVNELRASFFANVIRRPLGRFKTKQLGELASEFSSDLSLVQLAVSTKLVEFLRHALFALGAIAALFFIDSRMTVLTLVGIAIVAYVILSLVRLATRAILAVQKSRSGVVALLVESASNAYVIQAYDRTEFMSERFDASLQQMFAFVRNHLKFMVSINPLSLAVFSMTMGGVVYYGIGEMIRGHLSLQGLVSYLAFAAMLVASVSQVGYLGGQLRQAGAMMTKHSELLRGAKQAVYPPLICETEHSAERYRSLGFTLQKIAFSYSGAEEDALVDITFSIRPGEVVAIVGESGAGKTTLVGILCGLLEPRAGSIEVWHDDLLVKVAAARPEIAIVPQEPFLFSGTFFENITFGRKWLTRADVQRAAASARIHDHIMTYSHGYDAAVEEAGKNLSRGQRQRVAIARALVSNPSVLLLDEATSSLDVTSERAIHRLINDLRGHVTVIVIAHQGQMLSDVDHVICIERGRLKYDWRPSSEGMPAEAAGLLGV